MSIFFDITHTTHYRYHNAVTLGEHRVMFRPRGSHDLRVLATDMVVSPEPVDIRLIQDVYSNSVALVQPQSPATELKIECSFSVEHTGTRARAICRWPRARWSTRSSIATKTVSRSGIAWRRTTTTPPSC